MSWRIKTLTIPKVKEARLSNSFSAVQTDNGLVLSEGPERTLNIEGTGGITVSGVDASNTVYIDGSSIVGVTDHGALTGLSDDDHTQYHNDVRGDARYYTETELDAGQLDNRYYTESEVDALLHDPVTVVDTPSINFTLTDQQITAEVTVSGIESSIDHGSIAGLSDDDHTQYLLADGTRPLSAPWAANNRIYNSASALILGNNTTPQHGLGAGDVVFGGQAQFSSTAHFDNTMSLASNQYFALGAVTAFHSFIVPSDNNSQLLLSLGLFHGRHLVLCDNVSFKDFDHPAQTNPTIFIHSATDPDTDNTQWVSLTHDQTNGVFNCGKGGISSSSTGFGTTATTATLGAGVTTFAVTSNVMTITGDAGGNTIATITGAVSGQVLTLIFVDSLVTITDDNTHASNSIDLSAPFTSKDDTSITLVFDGTSWYEVTRSIKEFIVDQEIITTQAVTTDTVLTDTLDNTPVSADSVTLFLNGVHQLQGAGLDYTISGVNIHWQASSGTAVDMETTDTLRAYYRYEA